LRLASPVTIGEDSDGVGTGEGDGAGAGVTAGALGLLNGFPHIILS